MAQVTFYFVFLISLVLIVLFTPAPPTYISPEAGCCVAYELINAAGDEVQFNPLRLGSMRSAVANHYRISSGNLLQEVFVLT